MYIIITVNKLIFNTLGLKFNDFFKLTLPLWVERILLVFVFQVLKDFCYLIFLQNIKKSCSCLNTSGDTSNHEITMSGSFLLNNCLKKQNFAVSKSILKPFFFTWRMLTLFQETFWFRKPMMYIIFWEATQECCCLCGANMLAFNLQVFQWMLWFTKLSELLCKMSNC